MQDRQSGADGSVVKGAEHAPKCRAGKGSLLMQKRAKLDKGNGVCGSGAAKCELNSEHQKPADRPRTRIVCEDLGAGDVLAVGDGGERGSRSER